MISPVSNPHDATIPPGDVVPQVASTATETPERWPPDCGVIVRRLPRSVTIAVLALLVLQAILLLWIASEMTDMRRAAQQDRLAQFDKEGR